MGRCHEGSQTVTKSLDHVINNQGTRGMLGESCVEIRSTIRYSYRNTFPSFGPDIDSSISSALEYSTVERILPADLSDKIIIEISSCFF